MPTRLLDDVVECLHSSNIVHVGALVIAWHRNLNNLKKPPKNNFLVQHYQHHNQSVLVVIICVTSNKTQEINCCKN